MVVPATRRRPASVLVLLAASALAVLLGSLGSWGVGSGESAFVGQAGVPSAGRSELVALHSREKQKAGRVRRRRANVALHRIVPYMGKNITRDYKLFLGAGPRELLYDEVEISKLAK